ncbi:MAG: T9SS type A sorting domain-containing protein [Bacteroidota bacterium]|nr:T9SS type A sorting domain-containing protein [Bacteroidota bacterium]
MKNKPIINFSILKKVKSLKIAFTAVAIFTILFVQAQETFIIDAGNDSIFCEHVDSFLIGGSPTAMGGISPYTYTWDIYPKPYIPYPAAPQINYYCSDLLNDTTLANPILQWIPTIDESELSFILTVSDNSGQTISDSLSLKEVQWAFTLGYVMIETFPGDTQTITPIAFGGGIYPYTYDWGASDSLLGGQYDYNVYANSPVPTREVIIPNGPSPKFYEILVTDSAGCQATVSSFQGFLINLSSTSISKEPDIAVFPNPVIDQLFIISDNQKIINIELTGSNGKQIDISDIILNSQKTQIDFSKLSPGAYNLQIESGNHKIIKKIIKI